jgi:hypothetical protein
MRGVLAFSFLEVYLEAVEWRQTIPGGTVLMGNNLVTS